MSKALPPIDDLKILEEDSRPKWDNKFQYILSCVGFAVGLGNVWRFPYLCQSYGGGAFLIPYLIALVLEGIPLFHLELAIGQRLRKGSIGVWSTISPYLGGVGFGSLMVSFLVSLYYNTILAWVMWYFMNSFQEPLPWSICPLNDNRTGLTEECRKSTAVSYFWYRQTLNITSDIAESSSLQWWLVLCLATCWTIVYICTIRGIETTGKVIYVTATFPYLVLTVFLIYGLTLPGAREGLIFLFTPNLSILKNPRVWLDAATQIFFSLSLAFGGHIAFSSYNAPKNDCEKDAVIIAAINSMTSLYASIPVFSILGFKATVGFWDCLDRNIIDVTNAFDLEEQCVSRDNYTIWIEALTAVFPQKMASLPLKNCDLQEFLGQMLMNYNPHHGCWLGQMGMVVREHLAAQVCFEHHCAQRESFKREDRGGMCHAFCLLRPGYRLISETASGTGLAFIVFTEAIIQMPGSQAWAILFFIMLFSLGLSTMFGNIESILTPLLELSAVPKSIPKEAISGAICLASFLAALCFTLRSGSYWLEMFDRYVGSLPLLIIAFFEVIGIVYIYGIQRFSEDVKWMTGRKPNFYWQMTWRFISPLLMLIIFVAYVAFQTQTQPVYGAWNPNYEGFPAKEPKAFPSWVSAVCVLLSILPCSSIPAVALYHFVKTLLKRKGKQRPHSGNSSPSTCASLAAPSQ